MLWTLLLVICVLAGSSALDENEWRDVAVEIYNKFTKSFEQHDYDKFEDLYSDDGEGLFPNGPTAGKGDDIPLSLVVFHLLDDCVKNNTSQQKGQEGLKAIIEKIPIRSLYFGFLELLYSSADAAMTRHMTYRIMQDGTVKKLKGVLLLVRENGQVRIKMGTYNSD